MSGGDSTGGGFDPGVEISCSTLFEKTILNSPKPQVLAKIKVNDLLNLQLMPSGASKVLVAMTQEGEVAGSITSSKLPKLIHCIEYEHFSYIATVDRVDGGRCEITIRPKAAI